MNKAIENQVTNWRQFKARVNDLIEREEPTTFLFLSIKDSFAPQIFIQLFNEKNSIKFKYVTWSETADWSKYKDIFLNELANLSEFPPTLVCYEGRLTSVQSEQLFQIVKTVSVVLPLDECSITLDGTQFYLSFGTGSPSNVQINWQNEIPPSFSGICEFLKYLKSLLSEHAGPDFSIRELDRICKT